jgi:hypothetical protein
MRSRTVLNPQKKMWMGGICMIPGKSGLVKALGMMAQALAGGYLRSMSIIVYVLGAFTSDKDVTDSFSFPQPTQPYFQFQ